MFEPQDLDTRMPTNNPENTFFTGSDEEDVTMEGPTRTEFISLVEPFHTPNEKRLFLPDSEDEDDLQNIGPPILKFREESIVSIQDANSDIEIPSFEELPRASSISSASSGRASVASAPGLKDESSVPIKPPTKKARLHSPAPTPIYLGSFVVGNAWSTVKGKGYVKNGEVIQIERDEQDNGLPPKGSKASNNGKKGQSDGRKKQLSIATMLKPQPTKFSKRKVDTAVRLTNQRSFEFGRLPQEVSFWVSKLLDMGLVKFEGCTMIDCPQVLHSGAELIVSLRVYIHPTAFQALQITSDAPPKGMFNQGQETLDERILRERKSSLLRLFNAVCLKPRNGADFGPNERKSDEELHKDALRRMAQHSKSKTVKTEIVGDGEEIEVEENEALSENELDMIYKKAQKHDRTMAEMEPSDTFTLTLRGYQKQALMWMHSSESGVMSARDATSMHPLWSEYAFPSEPVDGIIDLTADEKPFYFNPYSGELSLDFPKAERTCKGGILADVGMGKTIMLSALIQTHSAPEPEITNEEASGISKTRQLKLNSAFRPGLRPKSRTGPSATLIVAPTSLLAQWSEELLRSSKSGTINVLVWHGQNRLDLEAMFDTDDNDKAIKVIVTSYGVLASEHAKMEKSSGRKSPIFEIEWLRVVLDEAHHCKSRSSKTARAVYALQARRRWAVTGTPIVNKLEDLYSLLFVAFYKLYTLRGFLSFSHSKFLKFVPWSNFSFFRSFITLPFLARDPKAIEIVQVILESILLRREKNMRDTDGKRIVDLPAKEVTVENLEFSPLERKIYDSIYIHAKSDFEQLSAKGLVSKNYTHILAMLMRLRRAVLHPNLVATSDNEDLDEHKLTSNGTVDVNAMIKRFAGEETDSGNNENVFVEGVLSNLGTGEALECPICLDVMESPMIIPGCMHQCCKDCVVSYFEACGERGEERRCPTCSRGPIQERDLLEVVLHVGEHRATSQPIPAEVVLRKNDFQSSTKLEALIKNLRRLQDQDPCFRAVVFSQFTSFLDLIQVALQRERFDFHRFDGSMDVKKRNAAVSEFKASSRKPKVLIVSLKAGGVGLNLTAANHVFMMDCWWNAATENQAIDRVHRIGQGKTVYVKHFIIANTIEGRILQIQKRKTAIVKEAFRGKSNDKSASADPESIENLKIMFGDD